MPGYGTVKRGEGHVKMLGSTSSMNYEMVTLSNRFIKISKIFD